MVHLQDRVVVSRGYFLWGFPSAKTREDASQSPRSDDGMEGVSRRHLGMVSGGDCVRGYYCHERVFVLMVVRG